MSGKKRGGQKGHGGHSIRIPGPPDATVGLMPPECAGCPTAASCGSECRVRERRTVIDVPLKPVVTEYRSTARRCPRLRGSLISGEFPHGVGSLAQYGPRMPSLASLLVMHGMVSYDRTASLLGKAFGTGLSPATVKKMTIRLERGLREDYAGLGKRVMKEKVLHADGTGFRVAGKGRCLRVIASEKPAFHSRNKSRGAGAKKPRKYKGILSTGSPCLSLPPEHALCGAHVLKELKRVEEKARRKRAGDLAGRIPGMKDLKERLLSRGRTEAGDRTVGHYGRKRLALVEEGGRLNPMLPGKKPGTLKNGKVGALAGRPDDHMEDCMRFLTDFRAPFADNPAERCIRVAKVKRKVSGGLRTARGATGFAVILSCVRTAALQGLSFHDSID